MQQGVEREGWTGGQEKGVGAPGHRLQVRTAGQHLVGRKLARIQADGHIGLRRVQGVAERIGRRCIVMLVHEAHEVLR